MEKRKKQSFNFSVYCLPAALIFIAGANVLVLAGICPVHFYPWLEKYDQAEAIVNRISPPAGYKRANVVTNSFEDWLRHLPLKKGKPPVYLYNGRKKIDQEAHFAVIDIDVGKEDLQQCADAIIRLRAEYFYSIGNYEAICFNFTDGISFGFKKWADGYRPVVKSNKTTWIKPREKDFSYSNFRQYLDMLFAYTGSYSLSKSKELQEVKNVNEIKMGDVFIKSGFPGHAAIVVDMAKNKTTGKKIFLLAQSFMPAQDIHILINPNNSRLSPWYEIGSGKTLCTPEWTFTRSSLKRFKENKQKEKAWKKI